MESAEETHLEAGLAGAHIRSHEVPADRSRVLARTGRNAALVVIHAGSIISFREAFFTHALEGA